MTIAIRVLSLLFGAAVAVFGFLAALEIMWAWMRPSAGPLVVPWPTWLASLEEWNWASAPVRLIAVALMGVGLLVLALSLRTDHRPVWLIKPAPEVTVTTTARSLARLVARRVRELDRVSSASVTATSRKISVRVASHQPGDATTSSITEAVRLLLSELPLAHTPQVSVTVRMIGEPA